MAVTLANTLDLKGRVMLAKWHARQLDSNGLALALDEFGDDLDLMADLLGQRMVALGQQPRALPADVSRMSRLPPFKHAILWDSQLLDGVGESLEAAKQYLEPTTSAAIDARDAATVDVL
jgi:DNA-binding ferritin-like protein